MPAGHPRHQCASLQRRHEKQRQGAQQLSREQRLLNVAAHCQHPAAAVASCSSCTACGSAVLQYRQAGIREPRSQLACWLCSGAVISGVGRTVAVAQSAGHRSAAALTAMWHGLLEMHCIAPQLLSARTVPYRLAAVSSSSASAAEAVACSSRVRSSGGWQSHWRQLRVACVDG